MPFKYGNMTLHEKREVSYLTFDALSQINFIHHAFSTRHGGVSSGEFSSMNLSFTRGDSIENVTENYKRFCESAGFEYESLVASSQDHNVYVRQVSSCHKGIGIYRPQDMKSVDALMTNEPGVTLVTYYADCTPLFFVDVVSRAIALAHAGWRGTVRRIGKLVLEQMQLSYGTVPQNVVCAIGPAISRCCYEVDKLCAGEFLKLDDLDTSKFVFEALNGKSNIDLSEANSAILEKCSVQKSNIYKSGLCTKCHSDLLWSHRATNGRRGTMAAFLCINP